MGLAQSGIQRFRDYFASDNRGLIAAALLVSAIALGGGGSPNPQTELALQLIAALAAMAWLFNPPLGNQNSARSDRGVVILICGVTLALPVLQLVPLPAEIWSSLPGREVERAALSLVGEQDSWRPLSISPPRTLASLLAVVPPLILLLMVASLDCDARLKLLRVLVAAGLASVLLGAAQLASGGAGSGLYDSTHSAFLLGFQANRNAQADLLLCAMIALAGLYAARAVDDAQYRLPVTVLISLVFAAAVVLTGSRTGIALLPVAIISQALIVHVRNEPAKRTGMIARRMIPLASLAFVVLLGGYALSGQSPVLANIARRFAVTGDFRTELWKDGLHAIAQYWPIGSGTGTVVPAFVTAERLEVVDPTMPNRMHNDFLELSLESGAFGIAALIAVIAALVVVARRNWSSDLGDRPTMLCGLAMLAVIALHSLVDYPLRSMSLACVAALAAGLITIAPKFLRPGADIMSEA